MAEVGQVTAIKGDLVTVKLQRHDACDHCNACSAGVETEEMILEAQNICLAKPGDLVEIFLEPNNFLKAVLIMYIIPLISLLIGVGIGYVVGESMGVNSEVTALIVGFALLAVTYLTIRSNEDRFHTRKFRPVATNVVKEESKEE